MIEGTCHCGAVSFRIDRVPDRATACSCTICRRYGVLWAYGWEDEDVHHAGETVAYLHGDRDLAFHHCPTCGCVAWWRGAAPDPDGRTRMAVNLRLAAPEAVAAIPMRHFDGFDSWEEQPRHGRNVGDMWF